MTDLQMGGYLLIRDFRRRRNKRGQEYGWHISVYSTPETLWGYDHVSSAYSVAPAESKALIDEQIWRNFPEAEQEGLRGVLENDPRPSYQHDPERVYGMEFSGLEVHFVVDGAVLTVTGITRR